MTQTNDRFGPESTFWDDEPYPPAEEDGRYSEIDPVAELIAELLDTGDLDHIPTLEPLVAGYLFLDTLARMNGQSGTFKSFVALDFAGCVGTGLDWHGHPVRRGLVVYIVAEGVKGMRKRVRAWEQHHGRKMTGVKFLPRPVQTKGSEWETLIEACRRLRPALIIIDTQARVTVGVEENSATEMGVFNDRVEKLRGACEACVLLVHHTGHEGEHGRGSTSVKGAMQTELGVSRKGKGLAETRVTVSNGKQKDDEEERDLLFALQQIKLAGEAKDDGSPVTSVVLVPVDTLTGSRVEPGSPEWIADRLDAANVPLNWGRTKVKGELAGMGVSARNEKISAAIQIRRYRTNDLSPNLSPTPNQPPTGKAVPDSGTGPDVLAGQTCPGQFGDRLGQGITSDLSPLSPTYREGTGGDWTAPQTPNKDGYTVGTCLGCHTSMTIVEPGQLWHFGNDDCARLYREKSRS